MTGALFGYVNIAKTATITANSEALPGTNVAEDTGSPSVAWQTLAGDLTTVDGALLKIAPASAQTWRVFGVFRTNLTASAVVTFSLYNNGSPPTLVWSATASPVAGFGQAVAAAASNQTADFLQITIDDATNPDNFLNVPQVFAGPGWAPSRSIGFSSSVGWDASQADVRTRGGQLYRDLLSRKRRWNIQLDSMSESEAWLDADPLLRTAATGQNVMFIPDTGSSYIQRTSLFGTIDSASDISYPYQAADRRRWSGSLVERL